MIYGFFLVVMFWLGAEAGASFPWSAKWQKFKGYNLSQSPEILTSILLGVVSMQGYRNLGFNFDFYIELLVFVVAGLIIYAGIQSATWMFLKWTKHDNFNKERSGTLKPFIDWIAAKIGWSQGEEGYSWVAATLKGAIACLPMGGFGGILFAFGYEIGSHVKGRVDRFFNPHIISEGMSFVGLGVYALIFLEVTKLFIN